MQTRLFGIAVATAGFLVSFVSAPQGQSAPLRLLASNGVKSVIEQVRSEAEKTIGQPMVSEFGTSNSLKELIAKGEAFDTAVMTSEAIDDLIKDGRLVAATRTNIGRVGIGVGIRSGTPKPDIKTPEAMKRTLASAHAITYAAGGASRPHIEKMIENLGIAAQMKPKTMLEPDSVRAAERVTRGDAELLITLISEILPVRGMELVGPIPPTFQSHVSFAGAVGAKSTNGEAAKKLLGYLSSPKVAQALKSQGIERF